MAVPVPVVPPTLLAPARVAFAYDGGQSRPTVTMLALRTGFALADGRVVAIGPDRERGVVVVRLRRDGRPDPSFGTDGRAHVKVPLDPKLSTVQGTQLVPLPNGQMIVRTEAIAPSSDVLPGSVLTRLSADGAVDPTFGNAGQVTLTIAGGQMVADPQGRILINGVIGKTATVMRLNADGTPDTSFGDQGQVSGSPTYNGGPIDVAPDGRIVVLVHNVREVRVLRLLDNGALDGTWRRYIPKEENRTWSAVRVRPDGSVDVLGTAVESNLVIRLKPDGTPLTSFGAQGIATLPGSPSGTGQLIDDDGAGGAYVVAAPDLGFVHQYGLKFYPVGPAGEVREPVHVSLPFGGGFGRAVGPQLGDQSGFRGGTVVRRADGSMVILGGVATVQFSGRGVGALAERGAVYGLTASLRPDATVGGRVSLPTVRVLKVSPRLIPPTKTERAYVRVRLRTSRPGLLDLRVRYGKQTIGRALLSSLDSDTQTLQIPFARAGLKLLDDNPRGLKVVFATRLIDLLGTMSRTVRVHATLGGKR